MKCASCHAGKGKRACKLTKDQLICPSCCASTRRDECVGCDYYEPCLTYQRHKQIRNKAFITRVIPDLDQRCDEALILVEQGDVDKGRAMLEGLQAEHPNYHMVLYGLGTCCALKDHLDEAIRYLERSVEIFPILALAHLNLGSAYVQKFDLEKAVKAYETAVEVDGEDGEIGQQAKARLDDLAAIVRRHGIDLHTYLVNRRIFERAFVALEQKQFETAIELYGQILTTDSRHVQTWGNLGLAYAGLGNWQRALECLNNALELDPDYEPAILNRKLVEKQQAGDPAPDLVMQEVSYYSQFKLPGRSYLKELAESLKSTDEAQPPLNDRS